MSDTTDPQKLDAGCMLDENSMKPKNMEKKLMKSWATLPDFTKLIKNIDRG